MVVRIYCILCFHLRGTSDEEEKPIFGIHDPIGLSHLTQLRVGLSKLNLHKFQHNFRDTLDPMCPSNEGIEDTEHFLLLGHSFDLQ